MALPIVYIFSHAFKPIEELFLWPPKFLVRRPTLKNFKDLMQTTSTAVPMARYLFNSVAITLGLVFVSIVISTMAGYALSKLEFKLKKPLLILNNIALMFVGASVVIPRYLVVEKLKLLDNFSLYSSYGSDACWSFSKTVYRSDSSRPIEAPGLMALRI